MTTTPAPSMSETTAVVDLSAQEPAPAGSPWEDLDAYIATPRLGSLALSHDGSRLVVGVQRLSHDKTTWTSSLTEVPLDGGTPHRLTRSVEGESAAAFLRDGSLLFMSPRPLPKDSDDGESVKALWCLPARGGEAYPLARRDGGWSSVLTARSADVAVFGVPFHLGATDEKDDAERRAARKKHKVSALLHEGYPIRYWDHDIDQHMHLLVVDHLTADAALDAESFRSLGDMGAHLSGALALSEDGSTLVAGWETPQARGVTTSGLVVIDVATGERRTLLEGDQAGDLTYADPVLDRTGATLACVRMTGGSPTTAPDQKLYLVDVKTGQGRDLAPEWDRWAVPVGFSPDGATLYVSADDEGEHALFAVTVADGSVRRVAGGGFLGSLVLSPEGEWAYAVRTSYTCPGEVVRINLVSGAVDVLDCGVSYPALPGRIERLEVRADDGARVPATLILPDGAEGPAPLALWIHGGPLGSWNSWSWRWCPWLLASQGYAVLLPDPALSTGYGLDYVQRGWGAWGDKPYTDLMTITDAVCARDDIDETRTCAMGGSFGGYMANWVATHTDRFKAIVAHASLWNLESFGPTTDAAFYWAREMSPEMRAANNPCAFREHITTPMLVVHGDRDYRVPIGEGLALWWTLNEQHTQAPAELPHKFLYFPDENHWVLQPQHSKLWYATVRAFLAHHVLGEEFRRPEML